MIQADDFWQTRRVAITGATGFVGHHLALLLVSHGARVTALVRRSSDCRRLVAAGVQCLDYELDQTERMARM